MLTRRIHTHRQVAQKANTQTKTCQRICLPQRTRRMRAKLIDNEINKICQCLTNGHKT